MTDTTDVMLYTPDMWNNLFSSRRLDSKKLKKRWHDQNGGELVVRKFDVKQSGLRTKAYDRVETDRKGKKHLPVMLLPIGHCAENIRGQRLKIIGPAIATRNDIFVFRSRKDPPPGSDVTKKVSTFVVAVREAELTTSNISRVVLQHSRPDKFFPPQGSPNEWLDAKLRFTDIRHAEEAEPKQRARALLDGKVHAAIFMGHELDMLGEFAEDLIDAANLNRLANNLYNVRLFPRALYVTFAKFVEDPHGAEAARAFAATINEEVRAYYSKTKEKHGAALERRTQQPSLTGPEASFDEIRTIIKFTEHMLHETFDKDREGSRQQQARHLVPEDFLFYEDVAAREIYPSLVDALRRIDVPATFACRPKSERASNLSKVLNGLCDRLAEADPCPRNQFSQRVAEVAPKMRFTPDDAKTLSEGAARISDGRALA